MAFTRPFILFATVAACGGNSNTIVPEGPHYHYVANKVFVPVNSTQVKEYGLDLDGNGTTDNVLGGVLSFLAGQHLDVQATLDKAVAEGSVNILVDMQTKDFMASSAAGFQVLLGANPQPAACNPMETYTCDMAMPPKCMGCQHQLTGTASFTIMGTPPAPLTGKIAGGTFTGGPGDLNLQIALGGTKAIELDLIGARAKVSGATPTTIGDASSGGAILAGAITQDDINMKVIPAIADQLGPIIARDCCGTGNTMHPDCTGLATAMPKCGCVANSTGSTVISFFDSMPADCAVTTSEIQNNSTIQGLLAPDVTIDGKMALSLGVKATAVGAMFTPAGQ